MFFGTRVEEEQPWQKIESKIAVLISHWGEMAQQAVMVYEERYWEYQNWRRFAMSVVLAVMEIEGILGWG
jgi:hypothetical protein